MRRIGFILFLMFLFCHSRLYAIEKEQREGLRAQVQWYAEHTLPLLKELKSELCSSMSGEEQALCMQTAVLSVADIGFGAVAFQKDGVPTILVPAGTIQLLNETSIVSVMGYINGKQLCVGLFIEQMADSYRQNIENWENGRDLVGYLTPFEFVKTERQYCPQVTEQQFRANSQLENLRGTTLSMGLRFILAHELAHHINGDTNVTPKSAAESRFRESRADIVGLRLLKDSKGNPIEAALVFAIIAASDDFAIDAKPDSTHPVSRERLSIFADALDEVMEDEEFRGQLRRDGLLENWIQIVTSIRELNEENE